MGEPRRWDGKAPEPRASHLAKHRPRVDLTQPSLFSQPSAVRGSLKSEEPPFLHVGIKMRPQNLARIITEALLRIAAINQPTSPATFPRRRSIEVTGWILYGGK